MAKHLIKVNFHS